MAEFSRHATVNWKGTLMEGSAEAVAGTGAFSLPVTFPRRVGEPEGQTSPEELIAAAHATCYSMVVAATMGRANATVARHTVKCTVTADKGEAGIKIVRSTLDLEAEGVSGMDTDTFIRTAREAEGKCPVSNALRGSLQIQVNVSVK